MSKKDVLDTQKLSKKYRTSIDRIIKAWKKGKTDMEISNMYNIDFFILKQIRYDIESEHLRKRYLRWMDKLDKQT